VHGLDGALEARGGTFAHGFADIENDDDSFLGGGHCRTGSAIRCDAMRCDGGLERMGEAAEEEEAVATEKRAKSVSGNLLCALLFSSYLSFPFLSCFFPFTSHRFVYGPLLSPPLSSLPLHSHRMMQNKPLLSPTVCEDKHRPVLMPYSLSLHPSLILCLDVH
jgi:hypothetical protein